jgi:hypothetical protein
MSSQSFFAEQNSAYVNSIVAAAAAAAAAATAATLRKYST